MISFPKPVKVKESQLAKAYRQAREHREKMWAKPPIFILKRKLVKKKSKRVKLPSIRKLILKADKLFSLFIRQRDLKCVLCGSTSSLTNGHLVKRGKKQVRWDELNCHCLCMGCNWKDNFDHDVYVLWFIKNYGALPYQDLVEKSRGVFKPSREYLLEIIKRYETKS